MAGSFNFSELKELLDEKADLYNNRSFIETDPILIPHQLSSKEDIESIAFIMATISWGNRQAILKNGFRLLDIMGNEPHRFILQASPKDLRDLTFVHRTFNSDDLCFFIRSLRDLYVQGGFENSFGGKKFNGSLADRIEHFRNQFLAVQHDKRSEKHISSPLSGSACKRINMFLRWMVRSDKRGVDFGIWKSVSMTELYIPLDVHTARVSLLLGLTRRKQNDWKTLEEIMLTLRKMDPKDPCKYDFALFGMSINELQKLKAVN